MCCIMYFIDRRLSAHVMQFSCDSRTSNIEATQISLAVYLCARTRHYLIVPPPSQRAQLLSLSLRTCARTHTHMHTTLAVNVGECNKMRHPRHVFPHSQHLARTGATKCAAAVSRFIHSTNWRTHNTTRETSGKLFAHFQFSVHSNIVYGTKY